MKSMLCGLPDELLSKAPATLDKENWEMFASLCYEKGKSDRLLEVIGKLRGIQGVNAYLEKFYPDLAD
jgi:hypothetical protein